MGQIAPEIKQEVLERIKNEGWSCARAAREYSLSPKTVYSWIHQNEIGGSGKSMQLEINRLKKELDNAYRVIGQLSIEVKRPKG